MAASTGDTKIGPLQRAAGQVVPVKVHVAIIFYKCSDNCAMLRLVLFAGSRQEIVLWQDPNHAHWFRMGSEVTKNIQPIEKRFSGRRGPPLGSTYPAPNRIHNSHDHVLVLKTCQKVTLFGTFSGRVRGLGNFQ